ncbi:MAG: hypothetical protein LBH01_01005 [Verrucomicrobiales bacterium]|jgi:hypothetical protein|nr:hypothetical protein [Verrucomicrobiales bacterium]
MGKLYVTEEEGERLGEFAILLQQITDRANEGRGFDRSLYISFSSDIRKGGGEGWVISSFGVRLYRPRKSSIGEVIGEFNALEAADGKAIRDQAYDAKFAAEQLAKKSEELFALAEAREEEAAIRFAGKAGEEGT